MRKVLAEKMKESVLAVVPISAIVLLLHVTIAPLPEWTLAAMLVGMVMLFLGMTLFSIGVEMSMMPIGQHVGSALIASRNLPLIIGVLFVFGFVATMAEPDLSVLADQVSSIPTQALLIGISVGVGVFLVIAVLRVVFHWKLGRVLAIAYPIAFIVAIFSSDYLAVAVDSAAVTTGPVTVPFLLAIGSGFAAVSNRKDADEDTFGISAICSVGPIISVLILGMFFESSGTQYQAAQAAAVTSGAELITLFLNSLWHSLGNTIIILLPILAVFLIFQIVKLKLSRSELIRIFVGLGYLLIGMTIFLSGVNEGFLPAAIALGETLGALEHSWVLIPIALVIGASVVLAEPTVYVLVNQVREITHGAIPKRLLLSSMALGVGIAMALSIIRILYGFSIWWILLPGYALSLTLTFFTPNMFVGIGFDAGEVVTGAMSAAFVIPFAIGVCSVIPGRNIVADAFGIAGVLTMVPPIIIQTIGLIYSRKLKKARRLDIEAVELSAETTEAE
ncbi:MAG TPA: DUF1538 domain-containing protein [Feifaniaceae bacterium]|nr:DUF1538 domain-containing protein [Feifaniaceae bacterium]